MSDREECRNLSYSNDARDGQFCSTGCEIKYGHLRDDARVARRDAEREAREEDGL